MIVRLDLERHGVPVPDVDDAGVLADVDHQVRTHLVRDLLAELPQVHLRRLVGAVLAPHDRVHRQLRRRRSTAQDLADVRVLVGLQAEGGPGLVAVGAGAGRLDGVDVRTLLGQRRRLQIDGSGMGASSTYPVRHRQPRPAPGFTAPVRRVTVDISHLSEVHRWNVAPC
jgi:hypothetical protein